MVATGTRPRGASVAQIVYERRRSGSYGWSLSPTTRPFTPRELEAMEQQRIEEQDLRERTAARLLGT